MTRAESKRIRRRRAWSWVLILTMLFSCFEGTGISARAEEGDSVSCTFYYYAGDVEDGTTVGVYHWGTASILSSTAEKMDIWGETNSFVMSAVNDYAGWYSVPFTIDTSVTLETEGNFQICTVTGDSSVSSLYEIKTDSDSFTTLKSGGKSIYAMRNSVLYSGDSEGTVLTEANAANAAATYTLEELNSLISASESIVENKAEYETGDVYESLWETFEAAVAAAKAVAENEDRSDDEITAAYESLAAAKAPLALKKAAAAGELKEGNFGDYSGESTEAPALTYWTGLNIENIYNEWMTGDHGFYMNSDGGDSRTVSLRQRVSGLTAGSYTFSIEAGGSYAAGAASIEVVSGNELLASAAVPAGTGWGVWESVSTPSFTLDSDNEILIRINGTFSSDEYIHLDNAALTLYTAPSYSKEELAELVAVGNTVKENKDQYETVNIESGETYAEAWTAFEAKLAAAAELSASDDAADDAIVTAYEELEAAIKALTKANIGGVVNGGFEDGESGWSISGFELRTEWNPGVTGNFLYKWSEDAGTAVSAKQRIKGIEADKYVLSLSSGGNFTAGDVILNVYSYKDGVKSELVAGDQLPNTGTTDWSLDGSYTSAAFELSGDEDAIYIEISGSIGAAVGLLIDEVSLGHSVYKSIKELQALVEKGGSISANKSDYKTTGDYEEIWTGFETALKAAQTVLDKCADGEDDGLSDEEKLEITEAYDNLDTAMRALRLTGVEAPINVESISLSDDFITGADISSWYSLRQSGVVFKDENGDPLSDQEFFNYLYDSGVNWVRLRVWNDPYDAAGNGYGGGNNDLEKAKIMGRLAADAGMRVLIDFHYSDFWADPAKQDAPKAWEEYTLDEKVAAVKEYTLSSLTELYAAGVDVGMVQVGNETNGGICGETGWESMAKIFSAGSEAVREFEKSRGDGASVLVAVHFTQPSASSYTGYAESLKTYGVDYDVFASSYYPFWHEGGTWTDENGYADGLYTVLKSIAKNYDKKVMVAETSWVNTWEDFDGHGNSAPGSGDTLHYNVSEQGQADELREVVNAINNINLDYKDGAGLGVFYWEPAWISPYYAYNADGSIDQSELNKNKAVWEKYGSGWASSYSYDYDPEDAGLWYGGSAVDNQSWFYWDGTARPTAKTYSYIRSGAVYSGPVKVEYLKDYLVLTGGKALTIDESMGLTDILEEAASNVTVSFSNGLQMDAENDSYTLEANDIYSFTLSGEDADGHELSLLVKWNEDEAAAINPDKPGWYKIYGSAEVKYCADDEYTTEYFKLTLELELRSGGNVLDNPGFETGDTTDWDVSGEGIVNYYEDPHSGAYGVHFWSEDSLSFTVSQNVTGLAPGNYTFGTFLQGGGAGMDDKQTAYVELYNEDGSLAVRYKQDTQLAGWLSWKNPEISGIHVDEGQSLTVGMEINSTVGGAWGTIDDFYLYGSYAINLKSNGGGSITASDLEPVAGQTVHVKAEADAGYVLKELELIDSEGTESLETEDGEYSFSMGNESITISANFAAIGDIIEESSVDISEKNSAISVSIADMHYTGKALEPEVTVTYTIGEGSVYTLTDKDYSVKFSNNKGSAEEDSEGSADITGKGVFAGSRSVSFKILKDSRADISSGKALSVNFNDADESGAKYYYTGSEVTPAPVLKLDNITLVEGKDYALYYTNNIKVGTATMVIVALDEGENIRGSKSLTYKIVKRPLSSLSLTAPSNALYTGSAIKPDVTLKYGSTTLQKGVDYSISYKNNTKPGTATIKLSGKGNYSGTLDSSFTIRYRSLADTDIEVEVKDAVATGKDIAPKLTVKCGTKTIPAAAYTITSISQNGGSEVYSGSGKAAAKDEGSYIITIKATNAEKYGYYGSNDKISWTIAPKAKLLDYATVKTTAVTYPGSAVTLSKYPDAVQLTASDGTGLALGRDYKVKEYKNNSKAGTATIVLEGMGSYAGSKTVKLKIEKRKLALSAGPTVAAVTYSFPSADVLGSVRPYTGYKQAPALYVYADGRRLTAGVDYSISFKKNVNPGAADAVVKGKGSYSGSVTLPEVFTIKDVTLDDFVISMPTVEYNGKAQKPEPVFVYKASGTAVQLKPGTAYTAKYSNNKAASPSTAANAPQLKITEKGLNAKGTKQSRSLSFTISAAAVSDSSIAVIKPQSWKGKAVTPKLTVKVGGSTLKAGQDYTVSYSNNRAPGLATVTISAKGNYSGTAERTFVIK